MSPMSIAANGNVNKVAEADVKWAKKKYKRRKVSEI